MSEKDQILIDNYINNELTEAEAESFKARISSDPEFKALYETTLSLKEYGEFKAIKERLRGKLNKKSDH